MTAYLLDTHVLVWSAIASDRLSTPTIELLSDPGNEVFVSSVSIAEIVIKQRLGKLQLPVSPLALIDELGMSELVFTGLHAQTVAELPLLHRDPFDRWLIAQAITEHLVLVTADAQIHRYDVDTLDPSS